MTIAELIATYLAWSARHRAPATIKFHRARLASFLAKFGPREISSLTSLEIDAHLDEAGKRPDGRPYSDSTRHHNAVSLIALQNFAWREGLLETKWCRKVDKPRMGRRERIPTDEEVALLLAQASPAFRLIYNGLAQSGARPGELCRATIADAAEPRQLASESQSAKAEAQSPRLTGSDFRRLDNGMRLNRAIVLVEHKTAAKTGKPRRIAIGRHFAATLRAAIGERTAGPIFLAPDGVGWSPANLSATHRRLRDKAGLEKTIVLYSARHGFATRLLQKKTPIKDVADLMGHEHVSTTELYTHRDVADLADSQDLASPDESVDPDAEGGPKKAA